MKGGGVWCWVLLFGLLVAMVSVAVGWVMVYPETMEKYSLEKAMSWFGYIQKEKSNSTDSVDYSGQSDFQLKLDELKKEMINIISNIEPSAPNSGLTVKEIETYINNLKLDEKSAEHDKLILQLRDEIKKLEEQVKPNSQNQQLVTDLNQRIQKLEQGTEIISPSVQSHIMQELSLLKADGTAKVDYALSNNGAKVISVSYPDSYTTSLLEKFFSEDHKQMKQATNVIETNMDPGKCWSFIGHRGNLTIKLSCPIVVSQISIEHPDSKILLRTTGVPHRFQVYGTHVDPINNQIINSTLLVENEYKNTQGSPLIQEFPIMDKTIWNYVTLVILSNHNDYGLAEEDYTCVYRFRVHSTNGCSKIREGN